jgi:hypothetical protein
VSAADLPSDTAEADRPLLTRDDLVATHRVTPATAVDRRVGGALLLVVLALGVLLAVVYVHADLPTIADDGWRGNANWAAAVGLVLLGVALAVITWTYASASADSTLARSAVLASVIGVVGAVLVIGLADENGGQLATSSIDPVVTSGDGAAPTVATEDGVVVPEPPLGLNEALQVENLTSVAFPVEERTFVSLELTNAGRDMLARAMGCRPADLAQNTVLGTIVGGTWIQPLVVVGPPVREDDSLVARCHRVATRLPTAAGFAVPRF